jgi:leucyl aminopeptidase
MRAGFVLLALACAVLAEKRLIAFNQTYSVWMDSEDVAKLASECGAKPEKGFIDITDHQTVDAVADLRGTIPVNPRHPHIVADIQLLLKAAPITSTITHLSTQYPTRYYTSDFGLQAATWIQDKFLEYAKGDPRVTINLFQHTWVQPSVVAIIRGSGPRANEVVVIGGHEDSTSNGATAPGADDDGSGTATVLEVFRVIMESGFQPDRSIHFHTYAAEEVGLRGSQAIAEDYRRRNVVVAGMLQFDMTGFNPNNLNTMSVITDFTDVTLSTFVRKLIGAYTSISNRDSRCGYGCSDHASWTRSNYPAAFVFETPFGQQNNQIHTVRDTISLLSIEHMLQFARLGVGYAVEMSL